MEVLYGHFAVCNPEIRCTLFGDAIFVNSDYIQINEDIFTIVEWVKEFPYGNFKGLTLEQRKIYGNVTSDMLKLIGAKYDR